ncbi:MAG: 50S ribosomal protein L11 methyltransferase [Verrucomicrobia bacterium]|nr:50S ribosomal protein L11 methyltransferase [Verrucomicrobiota bacterium]
MSRKALWKVSLAISPEAEESAAELMSKVFGQWPSIYTGAETRETSATVYLEKRPAPNGEELRNLRAGIQRLATCSLADSTTKASVQRVRREDWAESWKRHFKPLNIGSALLIKPSWSRRRPRKGQMAVVLDPGLSFGTGQHATTEFCLQQLVKARRRGAAQSFLDIGTGSGILAIAAAKLGYSPVTAFDFDPVAVRVARENVRSNRVEKLLRISRQDLTRLPEHGRKHHVVCANLIYDLLIQERRRILNRLRPDGVLVLAGILATQFPRVREAYAEAGLELLSTRVKREWQSGAFAFRREQADR